jgi:nicotinamidase-related amidase
MSALIIVNIPTDVTTREGHDAISIINLLREQNPWAMIVRSDVASHVVTSPEDVVVEKGPIVVSSLIDRLKAAGVTEVTICGFDTDSSIRKTFQMSVAAGFETDIFFNASHFTSKEEYLAAKELTL